LKRKSKLFYLALSAFLPPVGVILLSVFDLFYSQRNIETLARSYVENFTEIVVSRIEKSGPDFYHMGVIDTMESFAGVWGLHSHAVLGRLPALVAVLDSSGEFMYGSSQLRDISEAVVNDFQFGMAREVSDSSGERYTICILPVFMGRYTVIGGISWNDLPGAAWRATYIWPILICSVGLWSTISIWRLWRGVIIPLGNLEKEISSLKWGDEVPSGDYSSAVHELQKLKDSFSSLAQDAISKVTFIKNCMSDLVGVQEAERTKISRDIHDGPLQDVTALIQRLHLARSPDNTQEDTIRELELAEKIAMVSVREMRGLCDFLNPPWLDLGLQQALTELTERQSSQYGVRIFLDVDEDIEFPENVTLSFFRVVQEAVTNSVRHGDAKNIWVDVGKTEKGFELCVQDDGYGFDMHKSGTAGLRAEGHRGLSNMEERLALVGGELKIISYPGEGTCIRGFVPY
jgi:signal transduction histidine kinase